MKFKKYSVTNHGEGSITIMGLRRIEIPGNCEDHVISLPDTTAKATVARLKQQYPLLRFADYKESKNAEKPATDTETTAAVVETVETGSQATVEEQTVSEGENNGD